MSSILASASCKVASEYSTDYGYRYVNSEPKETILNLHPTGRLYKKSFSASTASRIVEPYIDPLLSIRNKYSQLSMSNSIWGLAISSGPGLSVKSFECFDPWFMTVASNYYFKASLRKSGCRLISAP